MKYSIVLFCLLIFIITSGCKESNSTEPSNQPKVVYDITDNIPYRDIGNSGKLVFQRIGNGGSYNKVVVTNLSTKLSYSIGVYGNGASVSPDGNSIAYTYYANSSTLWDTFIISLEGKNHLNISQINGQDQYPSWSIDSKSVFFYLMDLPINGHQKLYEINPKQYITKKIVYDFYNVYPQTHFNQSKSGQFVFVASTPNGTKLFKLNPNFSSNQYEVILDLKEIKGRIFTPCWSPDETKIAFVTMKTREVKNPTNPNAGATIYPAGGSIVIYDNATFTMKTIYEWEVADRQSDWAGFNELSVCWSPDGQKLAFNKSKSGMESHIYIINIDGTGLTQITNEIGVCDRSVSWSSY